MARARQYGHGRLCPRCNSNWCVKNGKPEGRQTFLCRQCGHRFVDSLSKEHEDKATDLNIENTSSTDLPQTEATIPVLEEVVVNPQPAVIAPEPVVNSQSATVINSETKTSVAVVPDSAIINPQPVPTISLEVETPTIATKPEPAVINEPPVPPNNSPQEPPQPEDTPPTPPLSLAARLAKANSTVNGHTAIAMGIGLIPIAGVDMIALAASQLKMIHSLANLYNINFCEQVGKSLIASLVSTTTNSSVMLPLTSALKFIPVLGQIAGPASSSILSGATTRAVGKVFIQHFESGGTLLNFNPEKVRSYFAKQLKEGQQAIRKGE